MDFAHQQNRVMRVFISSTFLDIDAEREILMKSVFPQLRRLCEERLVAWSEVDLRWGITGNQVDDGKFLSILLSEIEQCSHFIGILGERYGNVLKDLPQNVVARHPWLSNFRDRSITEIEMIYAALQEAGVVKHAAFFFRDPGFFVEDMPESHRINLVSSDAWNRPKLASLKERIRRSGHLVHENYRDPRELGALVFENLKASLNELFPAADDDSVLDRELAGHASFASRLTSKDLGEQHGGCYILPLGLFDRLNQHRGSQVPFVITGEEGIGKSALLANWTARYSNSHPTDVFVCHFVGATATSTAVDAVVNHISAELARNFSGPAGQFTADCAFGTASLRETLEWADAQAAKKGCRIQLVIDGLDNLEDKGSALDLDWLPIRLPERVDLIVSTSSGRPLDAITRFGLPRDQVQPLSSDERRQLINKYLQQYGKQLEPDQADRIAQAPQTGHPRFLHLLLDDLRVYGSHEGLDEQIADDLAAPALPSLYERLLERYEEDYEGDHPGLVKRVLTLLWAARRGLTEPEILEAASENGVPLPQLYLSQLRIRLASSLTTQSGLIRLSNNQFRQAIADRYLLTPEKKRSAHARLAEYFLKFEHGDRRTDELPWQLSKAESWRTLGELLINLDFLRRASSSGHTDSISYWRQIEACSPLRIVDAFESILAAPESHSTDELQVVAGLMLETGHGTEAMGLQDELLQRLRDQDESPNLVVALQTRGTLLAVGGLLDQAMDLFRESERISWDLKWLEGVSGALFKQAKVEASRGHHAAALELYRRQESMDREVGNLVSLSATLHNQTVLRLQLGDVETAQHLVEETATVLTKMDNRGFAWVACQATKGDILRSLGRFEEAAATLRQAAEAAHRINNFDLECRLLASLSSLLNTDLNQPADALHALREAVAIATRYGVQAKSDKEAAAESQRRGLSPDSWLSRANHLTPMHDEPTQLSQLAAALGHQAIDLFKNGHVDGALECLKHQEEVSRMTRDQHHLQVALGDQALVLTKLGRHKEAMQLLTEREQICKETADLGALGHCIGGQSIVAENRRDFKESLRLLQKQEQVYEELGDLKELSATIHNQAILLSQRMQRPPSQVLPLILKAAEVARGASGEAFDALKPFAFHLAADAQDEAFQYYDRHDLETANKIFAQTEQLARLLENAELLESNLGNRSLVLKHMGDLEGSLRLLEEQEASCRQSESVAALQGCLSNKALLLQSMGEMERALYALQESEKISRMRGDFPTLGRCLCLRGHIFEQSGDAASALAAYQEGERVFVENSDRSGLVQSWESQMDLLVKTEDLPGAIALAGRQERICIDWKIDGGRAIAIHNRALLSACYDPGGALASASDAIELARELGLPWLAEASARVISFVKGGPEASANELPGIIAIGQAFVRQQDEPEIHRRQHEKMRETIISALESGRPMDYEKARQYARGIGARDLEAAVLQSEGCQFLRDRQLDVAIDRLSKALRVFEQLNDKQAFLRTCNMLGEAYRQSGDCDRARGWYEKSLAMSSDLKAASSSATAKHNLGIVCQTEADSARNAGDASFADAKLDEAESLFRESLAYWQLEGAPEKEVLGLGQLGRICLLRGELERAEEYARRSLTMREELGRTDVFIDFNTLGEVAQWRGDDGEAKEWFRKRDAAEAAASLGRGGGFSVFSIGEIGEKCVAASLRGVSEVPADIERTLRAYAETGPPLDVVAIFLRRLAQGAFPDNLPADIPPIFRDHLDNLLARAKEQGRHDAESDA